MQEILELIIQYASIWAPSVVSILGVVTTVLLAINKTREAISQFKDSDTALRNELRDVKNELVRLASQNDTLTQAEKDIVDKLSTIKNYTDASRGKMDD